MESAEGQGSVFHFTAPFAPGKTGTAEPGLLPAESLKGLEALVVDDNLAARETLAAILKEWGMKPATAAGAEEALAVLDRAAARGEAPSLIFLDSRMPGRDGFQLAEQLRARPDLNDVPLVILTSSAEPGDRARCRRLGLDGFVAKPVRPRELSAVINAVLKKNDPIPEAQGSRAGPAPPLFPHPGPSLRVLVAEDNLVNQKLIMRLLEKMGHLSVLAVNGREALAALEIERFDAVLMDIQMPELDGLGALAEMKANNSRRRRRDIPVIAMTAYAMKGDREKFLEMGFDEYLAKPIKPHQLAECLGRLVARDGCDGGGPVPRRTVADKTGFNLETALNRVGGDAELFQEMTIILLDELPDRLGKIKKAILAGDPGELEREAHGLKGSLGYFSTPAAFEAARELVELARVKRTDGAAEIFETLAEASGRLEEALRSWLEKKAD
ncbi:MAG: response regulator [Pseudomonadota bacterium]